jgi:hypothetical protein
MLHVDERIAKKKEERPSHESQEFPGDITAAACMGRHRLEAAFPCLRSRKIQIKYGFGYSMDAGDTRGLGNILVTSPQKRYIG